MTNNTGDSYSSSVVVSGSVVHVVWNDNRDGNFEIYYKRNPTGNLVGINNNGTKIPSSYSLSQNYPNPFNPITKIKLEIPQDVKRKTSDVKLVVYDILGKEFAKLVNEQLQPGTYEVTFDGSTLYSGVYFYKIVADNFVETRKMILLK